MIQSSPNPAGSQEKIQALFDEQKARQYEVGSSSVKSRKAKLKALLAAVTDHRTDIQQAIYADFRKPALEVDLTEIFPVAGEIRFARKHLWTWMQGKQRPTPLSLWGASSRIHYEPKGVVLIISPWNYPFNLTFGPLVSAIAAGNCVMIKPSEHTPHTSSLMGKIIGELFDPSEVTLVEGGIEEAQQLLALPFNHIFFTGSPAVGKIVMEAAAKHLTSVTLELGGKSPTIIDASANIDTAAKRLAWGKFSNSGQICISPDYVMVHESKKEAFVKRMQHYIQAYYGEEAAQSPDFARMVNEKHRARVAGYVDAALAAGATLHAGGQTDDSQAYLAPTVLSEVPPDSVMMQEEIFGPVMPVLTFKDLDEPLRLIREKTQPLAIYIYSRNQSNIRRLIQGTRAGTTVVNHNVIQFGNQHLPFGGVNTSGIGKGHGFAGFEAFSNARSIMRQWAPFSATDLLAPPYTGWKQKIVNATLKWL